jgi:hypothetical protein
MGWASGSGVAADVWSAVRRHIPEEKRQTVAKKIIRIFENEDCDTIDEAEQLCRDAGMPNFSYSKCEAMECNDVDVFCPYHKWRASL